MSPCMSQAPSLANEETLHKQELEKQYYEIVHSGGPGNS